MGGVVGGEYGCKELPRPIALADASQLGFSGMDLLARALGEHSAPLRWLPSMGVVAHGPEVGESRIDLVIEYRNGEVRFVEPSPMDPGGGSGVEPARTCASSRLEVDVVVRVETAGGALAEEFPAVLRAVTPSRVELARGLPLDRLSGSFFVNAPTGHSVGALDIKAYFDGGAFSGTLSAVVEQRVGSGSSASVGATFVTFAVWP
jgi:hypothetical protein